MVKTFKTLDEQLKILQGKGLIISDPEETKDISLSLIEKNITEVEDLTQGQITEPADGKFTLQITKDDSVKLNPGEYALVINMVDKDTLTHLSGDGNNYAIYRVCYQ